MKNILALFISTALIFTFSILAIVPETSPAALCAEDMRLEAQKLQILKGESGLKHDGVWGDGGRAYGIAQFHLPTFQRLKKLAGRPELNWKKKGDQLWLFDWAIRNGHAHNWTVARWIAAEEKPAFKIEKKHVFKKGSARCPTNKAVHTIPAPEISTPAPEMTQSITPAPPSGPTFEMPLVVHHADVPVVVNI